MVSVNHLISMGFFCEFLFIFLGETFLYGFKIIDDTKIIIKKEKKIEEDFEIK